jgi:hypothetical protein
LRRFLVKNPKFVELTEDIEAEELSELFEGWRKTKRKLLEDIENEIESLRGEFIRVNFRDAEKIVWHYKRFGRTSYEVGEKVEIDQLREPFQMEFSVDRIEFSKPVGNVKYFRKDGSAIKARQKEFRRGYHFQHDKEVSLNLAEFHKDWPDLVKKRSELISSMPSPIGSHKLSPEELQKREARNNKIDMDLLRLRMLELKYREEIKRRWNQGKRIDLMVEFHRVLAESNVTYENVDNPFIAESLEDSTGEKFDSSKVTKQMSGEKRKGNVRGGYLKKLEKFKKRSDVQALLAEYQKIHDIDSEVQLLKYLNSLAIKK